MGLPTHAGRTADGKIFTGREPVPARSASLRLAGRRSETGAIQNVAGAHEARPYKIDVGAGLVPARMATALRSPLDLSERLLEVGL